MGLYKTLKRSKETYAKQRAETRGYRKLVAEKTKLASRQAFADEAVKVARERARAKARAPSFGQRLGGFAQQRLAPQPARRTARTKARKATKKRYAPARRTARTKARKATKKRYAPARRTAPKQQIAQAPISPTTLSHAIYGGY